MSLFVISTGEILGAATLPEEQQALLEYAESLGHPREDLAWG